MADEVGQALAKRISAALSGELGAADLSVLIRDVEAELCRLRAANENATQLSLDPRASDGAANRARAECASLQFSIDRIEVAFKELRLQHVAAVGREKLTQRQALRADVLRERDELAAELQQEYPRLATAIADLLARVEANDTRVQAANGPGEPYIHPAANFTLTSVVRLPSMSPIGQGKMLWPPPPTFNPMNVITPQMREFSEARGAEMRRVADVVAAKKREEVNSPRRRIP